MMASEVSVHLGDEIAVSLAVPVGVAGPLDGPEVVAGALGGRPGKIQ